MPTRLADLEADLLRQGLRRASGSPTAGTMPRRKAAQPGANGSKPTPSAQAPAAPSAPPSTTAAPKPPPKAVEAPAIPPAAGPAVIPAPAASPAPPAPAPSATPKPATAASYYEEPFGTEIPLDPGVGGMSIGTDALQPADILVSTVRRDAISGGIRAATGSQISHAAIYLGGGEVVEAIGSGIVKRPLADAVAGSSTVVAFRYPGITTAQATTVTDYARRRVGGQYNYLGIVRQAGFQVDRRLCGLLPAGLRDRCIQFSGRVRLGPQGDNTFYCSELVVAAFQAAGIPLTGQQPNQSVPQDLVDLQLHGVLAYVGHLKAETISTTRALEMALGGSRMNYAQRWAGLAEATSSPVPPPPGLNAWRDLMSFRPPAAVQTRMNSHLPDWHIHKIETGHGDINLDYYPVTVTKLPMIWGRWVTAEELLENLRLNINNRIDNTVANFEPYNADEGRLWTSANPTGAVIHIDMRNWHEYINPDDGSVVCSEWAPDHWIFSTIWTPADLGHPVSGNRKFGFTRNEDGSYTFYTRGADRCTGNIDNALSFLVFGMANALWLSLQQGLARFINNSGGTATIGVAHSERYDWDTVRRSYYAPTVPWL